MTALERKAAQLGIRPPGATALRRYGLTTRDWLEILANQGWVCPVCETRPTRWNIDHEHVAGWKKMTPEERRRYVRGVLCAYCNYRRVNSRMPAAEAQRIAAYLAAYEARRDA